MVESRYCDYCQKEVDARGGWKIVYPKNSDAVQMCHRHFTSTPLDLVPQRMKDDRVKYRKDIVQPFRGGELSKEYLDTHGTKGISVTKEEVKKAKYVWKGTDGW